MPLAAGAGLSLLVLTLAFFGQSWPGWLVNGSRLATESAMVLGTIQDLAPASSTEAPATEAPVAPTAGGAPDGPAGVDDPGPVSSPPETPAGLPAAGMVPQRRSPLDAPPHEAGDAPRLTALATEAVLDEAGPDDVALGSAAPEASTAAAPRRPPIPLFRPRELAAQLAAQQKDATSGDLEPGTAPVVVPAAFEEPPPVAAAPAGIRVFIHYTADDEDAAMAKRLAAFLQLRGFTVAGLRPMEFRIGQAGLRYFYARDYDESVRLLEDIDWFFESTPERAPQEVADFTRYQPRPGAGAVEFWLPTS